MSAEDGFVFTTDQLQVLLQAQLDLNLQIPAPVSRPNPMWDLGGSAPTGLTPSPSLSSLDPVQVSALSLLMQNPTYQAQTLFGLANGIQPLTLLQTLPLTDFTTHMASNSSRQSVSQMPSPIQSEIRPRAFSSAAALQSTKGCPRSAEPKIRRKRSRKVLNETPPCMMTSPPAPSNFSHMMSSSHAAPTFSHIMASTQATPTFTNMMSSRAQSSLQERHIGQPSTNETQMSSSAPESEPVSILRILMDEEASTPVPQTGNTENEDERLRREALKVFCGSLETKPEIVREEKPHGGDDAAMETLPPRLRRIIRDQDLPETVGPDSPFRHHPKYQRRARDEDQEIVEGMQVTAFCIMNSYLGENSPGSIESVESREGAESLGATSADRESPKKSLEEILDQAIVRELVCVE